MNIRFVSAQRGKKTRSATSRYRRLRLGALRVRLTCLRLRFWFLTGSNRRKKKTKTRQARNPFQSAHCAREVLEEIATCRLPLCSLRSETDEYDSRTSLAVSINDPCVMPGTGKPSKRLLQRTLRSYPLRDKTKAQPFSFSKFMCQRVT